jgi:hypothetical protein
VSDEENGELDFGDDSVDSGDETSGDVRKLKASNIRNLQTASSPSSIDSDDETSGDDSVDSGDETSGVT